MKEQLAAEANGDTRRFLDQMDSWLAEHPHGGPVVNSPEELQARTHARAHAKPPNRGKPYLVHDPIIAEIHRTREALYREREAETLVLKDEPLTKRVSSVGQVMFNPNSEIEMGSARGPRAGLGGPPNPSCPRSNFLRRPKK